MKPWLGFSLLCAATFLTACGPSEPAANAEATAEAQQLRGHQCPKAFMDEYREVDSLVMDAVNDIRADKDRRGSHDRNDRRVDDSSVIQAQSNAEGWLFVNKNANCLEVSFSCVDEQLGYDQCPQGLRKVTMSKINLVRLQQGIDEINSYLEQ